MGGYFWINNDMKMTVSLIAQSKKIKERFYIKFFRVINNTIQMEKRKFIVKIIKKFMVIMFCNKNIVFYVCCLSLPNFPAD